MEDFTDRSLPSLFFENLFIICSKAAVEEKAQKTDSSIEGNLSRLSDLLACTLLCSCRQDNRQGHFLSPCVREGTRGEKDRTMCRRASLLELQESQDIPLRYHSARRGSRGKHRKRIRIPSASLGFSRVFLRLFHMRHSDT